MQTSYKLNMIENRALFTLSLAINLEIFYFQLKWKGRENGEPTSKRSKYILRTFDHCQNLVVELVLPQSISQREVRYSLSPTRLLPFFIGVMFFFLSASLSSGSSASSSFHHRPHQIFQIFQVLLPFIILIIRFFKFFFLSSSSSSDSSGSSSFHHRHHHLWFFRFFFLSSSSSSDSSGSSSFHYHFHQILQVLLPFIIVIIIFFSFFFLSSSSSSDSSCYFFF
jgi:hypothetical protein